MGGLDFGIVLLFLGGSLLFGLRHARRSSQSPEQFFAAGRSVPWWLAGTSMVATTFAVDTPMVVAALVATQGVSGNWFWWSDVLPTMIAALVVAELWRRSGVLTDNQLIELRYSGRPALLLRVFRALFFGVIKNAIVLAWVNLAMLKLLQVALGLAADGSRYALFGLFAFTVTYTLLAGLWGVILTDSLQFLLAILGSVALAWGSIASAGGIPALTQELVARLGSESTSNLLSVVPSSNEAFWAAAAYLLVKSWASGNTEGNGYLAQRILATPDARHARLAALWFAIAHFALRPWPWILVGLVALVRYPDLADPEVGYVRVMLAELPAGLLGLMLASLLAAYMSTVDTHLNWGASYLTHDIYARVLRPEASERERVRVARWSVVALAGLGVATTFATPSIFSAWRVLASIVAGSGLILLLRWIWWRVNVWSEISVMAASLLATIALNGLDVSFPLSLVLVVAIAIPVSLAVTLVTRPEPAATLEMFYRRVRPPGAWGRVASRAGEAGPESLKGRAIAVLVGTAAVYAILIGTGEAILGSAALGVLCVVLGCSAILALVLPTTRSPATQPQT